MGAWGSRRKTDVDNMAFLDRYNTLGLEKRDLLSLWDFLYNSQADYSAGIDDSSPCGDGDGEFMQGPNSSFGSVTGKTQWDDDFVLVENSQGLDAFTIFISFERKEKRIDIIVNTKNGIDGDGIIFGVNDANKFFVQVKYAGDYASYTFGTIPVGNRSIIALCVTRESVALYSLCGKNNKEGRYVLSETYFGDLINVINYVAIGKAESIGVGAFLRCDVFELAICNGVMNGGLIEDLLIEGFSEYTDICMLNGASSTVEALGWVDLYGSTYMVTSRMAEFDNANLVWLTKDISAGANIMVYPDGRYDYTVTMLGDGSLEMDADPEFTIYDGYVYPAGPGINDSWHDYHIEFSTPRFYGSFFVRGNGRRLKLNEEYFYASSLDLYYNKRAGGIKPKTDNIRNG